MTNGDKQLQKMRLVVTVTNRESKDSMICNLTAICNLEE